MTQTCLEISISKSKWSQVSVPDRLFYLDSCRNNLRRVADYWVEMEASLRGHTANSEEGAESWFLGPVPVARALRYLSHGLKSGGRPRVPSRKLRIDGRSVSRVFPHGFHEGLLFWGTEARVWSIGSQLQGARYRKAREQKPGPVLILGAFQCELHCGHRISCPRCSAKIEPSYANCHPVSNRWPTFFENSSIL